MALRIIGDVHGKLDEYFHLVDVAEREGYHTLQLGDFGYGSQHEQHLNKLDNNKHKILFGNHDDYNYVYHKHSLGDYGKTVLGGVEIFFVRGADSPDRGQRIMGKNWWPEEQLSYKQMDKAINAYEQVKPQIVVSHTTPTQVQDELFNIPDRSLTSEGLQEMLSIHQPSLWLFGHHHRNKSTVINDCFFKCIKELDTFSLDKNIK